MKRLVLAVVVLFACSLLINFALSSDRVDNSAWASPQANGKEYDKQTILVKFKAGVTKAERKEVAQLVDGKYKDKNDDGIDDRYSSILDGRVAEIELKGKTDDPAASALTTLEGHPSVEYANFNYLQYLAATPNDPRYPELWAMNNTGQTGGTADADIDAPEAWDISTGSSQVIIGVIDTGVEYTHEDLAANMWTNPNEIPGNGIDDDGNGYIDDVYGVNTITGSGDPMDDHYHGTHCSGTIAGVGNNGKGVAGVCWTARIIGIKFLNSGGSGTTADAIESVNYAIWLKNNGTNIRVLSNSWGGGGYDQTLHDAIAEAGNVGILFTAAAGNYSSNNDTTPFYPATYDCANILAVASTDHNDNMSSFSNYGATTVDLGAPGSSILSTYTGNSYGTLSGTSMATPHVSGAAGLLLSVNDQLTVQDLKDYLMDYGDAIPALSGMCVSGKRLNAYGSLSQVSPPGPPIADFTAFPTSGGVPLTVDFTDQSQWAQSWFWQFGDGGTSTEQNPTHTYVAMGSYTVTLTATNQVGSDDEVKTNYITVLEPQPPIADFTASETDINIGNYVTFTDTSLENPTSWSWTFEGGTPATSTEQNPTIQYNTVGTFDVTLVATNAQGSDTETKIDYITVSVKPYCTSSGSSQGYEYIAGVQVADLNNPSGPSPYTDFTSLTANLTQGEAASVALTPGFVSGSYTEYWKIWIDYNDDHDFEDTGEEVFSGYSSATVTGSFTVPTDTIIGDTRMRVSMSYSTYPPMCGTFTYGEVEDYNVNISDGGCPIPAADFSASATVITEGDSVTFTDLSTNNPDSWDWTFAGGTPGTSTQQNPTITYNTAGTYTVTLTASNACGSDTETKVDYITVQPPCVPPVADFSASATVITEGDSVTFTDLSTNNPDTWAWTFAGGTPGSSTAQNPTITYYTAGTYDVTLTATNACGSDTETKVGYITVNPPQVDQIYVYDITQIPKIAGKNYESHATVTIWDTNNNPVANATVYITWSGVVGGSDSGVTAADGTVEFKSDKVKINGPFTITVTNVTHATLPYNPDLNNETTDTAYF